MNKQGIVLSKFNDNFDTALISKWLKKEGEFVARGEIIAEIETDKANMEIASDFSGKLLQILFPVQSSVKVGEILCFVDTDEKEEFESTFDKLFGKITISDEEIEASETEIPEEEKNSALTVFENLFNPADSKSSSKENKSPGENSGFKKELCILLNIPLNSKEEEILAAIKNLKKIS